MTKKNTYLCAFVFAAVLTFFPGTAVASPALPPIAASQPASLMTTDPTTLRILTLQSQIDEAQATEVSIDDRIAVTGQMIAQQNAALDRANADLAAAQDAFDARAVAIYKFNGDDALSLLLDARSWDDFVSRLTVLGRILDADSQALEEASVVSAQQEFQQGQVEQLQAQQTKLSALKTTQAQTIQSALSEQQSLLPTMTPAGRAIVDAQQQLTSSVTAQWQAASVPIGTVIAKVHGTVTPHKPGTYLVSEFHYRTYRSNGATYTAQASWYGAEYNGRTTASGQSFNEDDFTCASPTLALGSWLAITRYDPLTKSVRRIVVVVNDRGPFVDGVDLDLSKAAADALDTTDLGVAAVTVEPIVPIAD